MITQVRTRWHYDGSGKGGCKNNRATKQRQAYGRGPATEWNQHGAAQRDSRTAHRRRPSMPVCRHSPRRRVAVSIKTEGCRQSRQQNTSKQSWQDSDGPGWTHVLRITGETVSPDGCAMTETITPGNDREVLSRHPPGRQCPGAGLSQLRRITGSSLKGAHERAVAPGPVFSFYNQFSIKAYKREDVSKKEIMTTRL